MNAIAPVDTLRRRSGDAIVYGGVRYRVPAESKGFVKPLPQRDWLFVASNAPHTRPTIKQIVEAVGAHFAVAPHILISPRRNRHVVLARHVAFYLAHRLTSASVPTTGKHCGDRDHTTIMGGRDRIALLMERDADFAARVRHLENEIVAQCRTTLYGRKILAVTWGPRSPS